jgi:hypothetical protein
VQSQKAQPRDKRVENDLLPPASKECVRVFSKTMASLMKGSMGILLEGPIHIGKHIKDGHISEHAQSKV